MSEAIIAALKMALDAGFDVDVHPNAACTAQVVTISMPYVLLSVIKPTLDDAAKFIEEASIELGHPRTVSMEDVREVYEEVKGKYRADLRGPYETPSAGIDPEPPAAPVTFKTIRERVLSAVKGGEDRTAASWALTQAAHELRQVPTQSFWNAADDLDGIVRDKNGDPVGNNPYAEVPA